MPAEPAAMAVIPNEEPANPLAPMATLEAARDYFALEDGASDAGYNAYNYMVLTAHAKPHAQATIPAVIHADGTGRIRPLTRCRYAWPRPVPAAITAAFPSALETPAWSTAISSPVSTSTLVAMASRSFSNST